MLEVAFALCDTRYKKERKKTKTILCACDSNTNAALQAQLKKAAKQAAKGVAAAAPGKMLFLEKGKDVITEQM